MELLRIEDLGMEFRYEYDRVWEGLRVWASVLSPMQDWEEEAGM